MQYVRFTIEKYRGIEKAVIELPKGEGARVTTLIGLNESGKTTILEAIYSFSPDPESKALYTETALLSDDPTYYIPRSEFSNFNETIKVIATVEWEEGEKDRVLKRIKDKTGIEVSPQGIPDKFDISSIRKYEASRLKSKTNTWGVKFNVKSGKQKTFRDESLGQRKLIFDEMIKQLPKIAYFPTFLFNFPEKIYLKGGPGQASDRFYKNIFQAILDSGGEGHKIDQHIVDRYAEMRGKSTAGAIFDAAAAAFGARSASEMIKQTVDKAADTVSDAIITKWDEIFPLSPLRKQILIESFDEHEAVAGSDGVVENKHTVWVEFKVKDSGTRYNISERSLGFRWFFCFLLFTKFMAESKIDRNILFLFDEPASNLHAKAQEKLLESFSSISSYPNSLIFSTHSHYMIEPTWLERAYVVKNDAIDYADASGEQKSSKGVKIEAIRYRDFVSQSDEKMGRMTYFQPVLDRLDVKPSRMDLSSECAVLEGKSDYHILTYIKNNYLKSAVSLVPAFGASTMRPVIGILRGWTSRFVVVLDDDAAGREAATAYKTDLDLGDEVKLLSDFVPGVREIEDIFDNDARERLRAGLGLASLPKKKAISRIFQEANASGRKLPLTRSVIDQGKKILVALGDQVRSPL